MNVIPFISANHIILLDNIPLDNGYVHTVKYNSEMEQYNDFVQYKSKYEYDNLVPIRQGRAIRVPINENDVLTSNYIMFQNSDYSNKWFYAFITDTQYINSNMCELSFELDVMQTWMFDYQFMPSFIERQHVTDDSVGSNLINDNLETGELVTEFISKMNDLLDCNIMACSSVDQGGNDVTGGYYARTYSGLQMLNMGSDSTGANTVINAFTLAGKRDAIISIFMMPKLLIDTLDTETDGGNQPKSISYNVNKKTTGSIGGYTPKNNKCYTYPYNYLQVYTGNGNESSLRYENFDDLNCNFKVIGETTPNPTIQLIPLNYNGQDEAIQYALNLSGYPMCAWTSDTYKAWLAQNASSLVVQRTSAYLGVLGSGLSAVGGAIATSESSMGGIALGGIKSALNLANAFQGIASLNAQKEDIERLPPQAHGNPQSNIAFNNQSLTFNFYNKHCKPEFMKIIDDYWTMYGYPIHELKMPNITARPYYTFLKTQGCNIKGNIPYNDIVKIRFIYDAGVTTWKTLANVGNYNLDNTL